MLILLVRIQLPNIAQFLCVSSLRGKIVRFRFSGYTSLLVRKSISTKSICNFAHAKSSDDQPLLCEQVISFLNHGFDALGLTGAYLGMEGGVVPWPHPFDFAF